MATDNHKAPYSKSHPIAAGNRNNTYRFHNKYPVTTSPVTARLTLEDLRRSRERLQLHQLQQKIAMTPPVDRHPPEKLGDFLPQWFEKNITKSGNLLTAATEALQTIVPAKLFRTVALGPLQRGQLTLYCSSSTAKMELDMLLRSGTPGLRQIQITTKGLIFKAKTVVNRQYSKS